MIRILIIALTFLTVGISAQNTNPQPTPAQANPDKAMEDAISEMSKMMDTMDLSKMMEGMDLGAIMQGLQLGESDMQGLEQMLDSLDLSMFFGDSKGIPGMEGMDMGKMMEQSMKMLEGMDMQEMQKMMEGIDMNEIFKMFEGMDMGELEKLMPTQPTEEKQNEKKLKKI